MLTPKVRQFLRKNNRAVLSTFRKNGAAQLSIVFCGLYQDGAAFTTTQDRAKLPNLRRNPACSLLVSGTDWRPYLVLEGQARLVGAENTERSELLQILREVYRAAIHREHPNWTEYDQAMIRDRRWAVIVVPERVYGPAA